MSISSDSNSLIIQQKKSFQLISVRSSKQKQDDIFELSNDDVSLSFKIQQQKRDAAIKYVIRDSKQDTIVLNLQEDSNANSQKQQKKKRREIFQKIKQSDIGKTKQPEKTLEGNLLNMFDEIFTKKPSQNQSNSLMNICGDAQPSSDNFPQYKRPTVEAERPYEDSRTPSAQKRQRHKIFSKKITVVQPFNSVLPPDILTNQERELRLNGNIKKTEEIASHRMRNQFEGSLSISHRVSLISNEENLDISKDFEDLNQILQAEIFNNQQTEKKQLIQEKVKLPLTYTKNTQAQMPQSIIKQLDQDNDPLQIVLKLKNAEPQIQKSVKRIQEPQIQKIIKKAEEPRVQKSVKPMQEPKLVQSIAKVPSIANIPLQQSQFLNESRSPSVYFQNYQNGQPQVSTAEIESFNFGEASSIKFIQGVMKKSSNKNISAPQNIKVKVEVENIFQTEQRIPLFLRSIRKHLSIYPNLYIFDNQKLNLAVKQQFSQLLYLLRQAVNLLEKACQKILDTRSSIKLHMEELTKNPSVQFFTSTKWQMLEDFKQIMRFIKPQQEIQKRQWNFEMAKVALSNYNNIVNFYMNRNQSFDFYSIEGKNKYFEIRRKFWDISGNMKLISQDIYCQITNCSYPSHYKLFSKYLSEPAPIRVTRQRTDYLVKLKYKLILLRKKGDLLTNSLIGKKIQENVQNQLKYHIPC